jgi:hypothetical protein
MQTDEKIKIVIEIESKILSYFYFLKKSFKSILFLTSLSCLLAPLITYIIFNTTLSENKDYLYFSVIFYLFLKS